MTVLELTVGTIYNATRACYSNIIRAAIIDENISIKRVYSNFCIANDRPKSICENKDECLKPSAVCGISS